MKARDLISRLQQVDGDAEIYFSSCCYPLTKWFVVNRDWNDELSLQGFAGSYVAGDPDIDPFLVVKSS